MRPKIKLTQEQYYQLLYKLFTSEDGELILDVWTDNFVYRKTALEGMQPLEVGLRQGETNFVLSIHNLINEINNREEK